MEDHGLAIATELNVQLDPEARFHGCFESGSAILDPARPMKPAMGEGPNDQSIDPGGSIPL